MTFALPGATEAIVSALNTLVTDLSAQAGANLAGLVLYGGLARGRYRAGRSDVNVVVLLNRADAPSLRAIAPALRDARRAAGVEAMLITPAEVPLAAQDFPTKFLDIQRHHVLLHGTDPFADLRVPRAIVQRRVAQSLRNLVLRLRHRYLTLCEEPEGLKAALADIARPLAIELAALLHLEGHALPGEDRTAALYGLAAQTFHLDAPTLASLASLRDGTGAAVDPSPLFGRLLDLLSSLADQVDHAAAAASGGSA